MVPRMGSGSLRCRVSGTLYALLMAHPLDPQGRCRSCRGPGAVFGRRRLCWVHREASYWLRQPEEFLYSHVVREWKLVDQSRPGAGAASARDSGGRTADLNATDMVPRIEPGVSGPPLPSVAPPEHPPSPQSGWSLLLTGGIT